MYILMLTLALASQTMPSVEQTDLYFVAWQEQFAYEASPDKQIPRSMRGWINQLGCELWAVREEASIYLYKHCKENPVDERWLFWGRQSRDLEISYRCDRIIARLHPCDSCKGNGESKYSAHGECWQCKGIGTIWGLHPWDD